MKCPVCKTELHEGTTICPICEFDQFQTEFINQEEYLLWKRDIVSSYYTNYYKKVQSTFEISENTIISYKGNEKEIIIPYGITAIAPSAFSRRGLQKEILAKNIIFPDTLVCIGEQAFSGCKHINEIIVPDSVISIGEMAFSNCESLSRIKLSNNIASIRSYLFSGTKIREIVFPKSTREISDSVCSFCYDLRTIIILHATRINGYAFSHGKTVFPLSDFEVS